MSNRGYDLMEKRADEEATRRASEFERLRVENAQLKRDAACFAALYEMAGLQATREGDKHRWWWVVALDAADGQDNATKDIERFRKAIEAGILA